ncbi:MAG: YjgN family protein [Desulfosalsimonadaceae bacterium]|nr:YjgN family protein [Desulfosalsimonadaceae bacterium]
MQKDYRMNFKGNGMDLFIIYIVNILLTIVTIGIYSFWAKVKVTKFLFRNIYFLGDSFDYHATGKEKFIGFLKGFGLILVAIIGISIINAILTLIVGNQIAPILTTVLVVAGFVGLKPLIWVGSHRFLLSRTSYRNVRFNFVGKVGDIYGDIIIGAILCIITLGFYIPWFIIKLRTFLTNNSRYGNETFYFDGDPAELLKIYGLGILLSILTMGIYSFWFRANLNKYFVEHTSFQGKRFSTDLTGLDLLKTTLVFFVLIIFTLGLGLPWAIVYFAKIYFNSLSIASEIDFTKIIGYHDSGASALADGVAEAGEALESVFDSIG